ncbi:MAG: hypothetical protein M1368_03285 [Thaumarchaeota archaeon]|nr:hypothetical protein [Nitrososphaerota archaeon]
MPKVSAVQIAPVYLNVQETLLKMERCIKKASEDGSELVVFPETCITMYCNWPNDPFKRGNDTEDFLKYYSAYFDSAVEIPGYVTDFLCRVAKERNCNIVAGVVEKDQSTKGVLYNSSFVIDNLGNFLGRHRKLTPVVHEQLFFARGSPEDVRVFDTGLGRLGISICFENMLTEYREKLASLGENIHCAIWSSPGFPKGSIAQENDVEYTRRFSLARSYAFEMGMYVILSSLVTPPDHNDPNDHGKPTWIHSGGSFVFSPYGQVLAKVDQYEEGIATANISLKEIDQARLFWNQFGKDSPHFSLG